MTFGERLRHARQVRELTQTELGAKIGTNRAAICKMEKGHRKPSFETLRRLTKSLNVTADYLLDLTLAEDTAAHSGHRARGVESSR